MKIAITGHSKGIGKACFDLLGTQHEVIGFSRSNGFNIVDQFGSIVRAVKNCDVFVNNAHQGYTQVDLLNAVFEMWKDNPDKTIVNISSLSKYPGLSGNQTGYSATKAALSHQAFLLMFKTDRKCRMININPGYVETDMIANIPGIENKSKITAEECANSIVWAINQPQHIEIGELSIWRPF
jgi:hypothetical protein